jgi:hypothetical protein
VSDPPQVHGKESSFMQLLFFLLIVGAVSGSLSGAAADGADGILLGSLSGVVTGILLWTALSVVRRTVREHRLNRYFVQDHAEGAEEKLRT